MTVPDAAIWDGSQWRSIIPDAPIAPDPGLQQSVEALTFATGWKNYGTDHYQATAVMTGRHVSIHGVIQLTASSFAAGGTILTVPAAMKPIGKVVTFVMFNGVTQGRIDMQTSGAVTTVEPSSIAQNTWVAISFDYIAVP